MKPVYLKTIRHYFKPVKETKGFTLLETIVVMGMSVIVLSAVFMAFHGTFGGLAHSQNAHQLQMELGDISDLLGGLLHRSDPRSIVVESSDQGPWSEIEFSADNHRYHFYGQNEKFLFTVDDLDPKILSRHLKTVVFALSKSTLPALLTWTIILAPGSHGVLSSSEISFSATLYLAEPDE